VRKATGVVASILTVLAIALPGAQAATQTITVFPAGTPDTGNCFPFGDVNSPAEKWGPNLAFVYRNLPAFQLQRGDILAFDTMGVNDVAVQLQIDLAPTTANGADVQAQSFTRVASNTQTPTNPTGDTTVGNFEMRFLAESAIGFPGGGLILRFSNPSAAYASDVTCTGDLVGAPAADSSGFFVERATRDTDGVAPWEHIDGTGIGAFQVIPNGFTLGKAKLNKNRGTALLPVTVPLAGSLKLTGKGVATQSSTPTSAAVAVGGAGTVKLNVKPKGKTKRKLNDTGKAKVSVTITYAPTGGISNTQQAKVKLKER